MSRRRQRKDKKELFGTSFFDMITCGLGGGMLLLFVIAAMVDKGGKVNYEVNIAEKAKDYYTLIAEFAYDNICPEKYKIGDGKKCLFQGQSKEDEVKITFTNNTKAGDCKFTLISAISVKEYSWNCFGNKTEFEAVLEKKDKAGFILQEP